MTDQIKFGYGLFLSHLVLLNDNELVLFFSEARVNNTKTKELTFNEGTEHFVSLKVNPIQTDESCKKYKVTFKKFFIYQVIEESAIEWKDDEVFTGEMPRKFTKSRFLGHIRRDLNVAWFDDVERMKYQHFQFACLNFLVDIAAHEEPTIEEVKQF